MSLSQKIGDEYNRLQRVTGADVSELETEFINDIYGGKSPFAGALIYNTKLWREFTIWCRNRGTEIAEVRILANRCAEEKIRVNIWKNSENGCVFASAHKAYTEPLNEIISRLEPSCYRMEWKGDEVLFRLPFLYYYEDVA